MFTTDTTFEKNYMLILSEQEKLVLVDKILMDLLKENTYYASKPIPTNYVKKRELVRALLNVRPPKEMNEETMLFIDRLLQSELMDKVITDSNSLPITNSISIWKGDITTLKVDAIVNAANEKLLGCFQALHRCIDNAVHSASGPRLRAACYDLMLNQGTSEPIGSAKLTLGYNLPSNYVLHTVGPIIGYGNAPTDTQKKQLISCYEACLNLASHYPNIRSIAFCCISTGVFHFPKQLASKLAIETVTNWQQSHNNHFDQIIFNVFTEEEYLLYQSSLSNYLNN